MSTLMAFDCSRCGKSYMGNWHHSSDYKTKLPDISICHGCRDQDKQDTVKALTAEFQQLTAYDSTMMLLIEVAVLRKRLLGDVDSDVHYWKAVVALAKEMRHGETGQAPDPATGQTPRDASDHQQG